MESFNRALFNICKEVYEQTISKEEGINKLVLNLKMNRGSAHMIIVQIFPQLLDGDRFTRTLSVDLFTSFLKYISEDYGIEKLKISLSGLEKHIEYSRGKRDAKIKLGKVYQNYLDYVENELHVFDKDEREQNEISNYLKKSKTRSELIEELNNTKDIADEKVTINHKSYKRDNKTIALIKVLRNFQCQICGHSITKRDGNKYVEAAHIMPKHKRGKENANNIILLCPNHHKEFDLGVLNIIEHNLKEVCFNLNGKTYNLPLAIN